jgi:hypothetical protein
MGIWMTDTLGLDASYCNSRSKDKYHMAGTLISVMDRQDSIHKDSIYKTVDGTCEFCLRCILIK